MQKLTAFTVDSGYVSGLQRSHRHAIIHSAAKENLGAAYFRGRLFRVLPEPKSKCSQRLRVSISYCHCKKTVPKCFIYFVNSPSELCIYTIHQLLYTRNCFLSAEVLLQCHLGKKFILQSSGPCINPNLHWVLTIHNRSIVACRVEILKQPL